MPILLCYKNGICDRGSPVATGVQDQTVLPENVVKREKQDHRESLATMVPEEHRV